MTTIEANSIPLSGSAEGVILKLDAPLSFWGGFEPSTGKILDVRHPSCGETVANCFLALPGTRGSGGTPAALAEALRCGVGPAAIILSEPDANLLTGALVADSLYDIRCPVVVVSRTDFNTLQTGGIARLEPNGKITITR